MPVIGYHASHEQIAPASLLRDVKHAESVGFSHGMCSDHLAPWSERQGESGFAWSWLGAALEATSMSFGVVNAPGQRYHPVIIAQAAATLAQMYPGRFWAALGSGEAMNEHVTGERWPAKSVREQRLLECVRVMRALLAGEEVSHDGHVVVDRARIWSLPPQPPSLLGAAVSAATAAWAATWADGLATVNQSPQALAATIAAYRDAGGRGPVAVQTHVSLAPTREAALEIAHEQWRSNVFAPPVCWDLDTPEHFDEASRHVTARDVEGSVIVTAEPGRLSALVDEYAALGADAVYLHHVGKEQRAFLDAVGEHVLGELAA